MWRGAQEIGESGKGWEECEGRECRGLPGGCRGISSEPGPRPLCCWLAASALGVRQAQPHYGDFPLPVRPPAHAEPPQIPSGPSAAPGPGPGRGAAVPTCGGRAGAASPGLASGSRRHGYGCTSAVREPPPHRQTLTDGHGAADPESPAAGHGHGPGCGGWALPPHTHTHHRHSHPQEVQGHPSAPTGVTSNPSPDTFLCPYNYIGALHPSFALSFWEQVPALPSQHL